MALSSRALSRALVLALIVAVVACALLMGAGSARAGEPGQTLAPVAESGDPGVISGRVTEGDGAPFDDACTITAYGYYYGFSYQASVREDGTYAIGPWPPTTTKFVLTRSRPGRESGGATATETAGVPGGCTWGRVTR